MSPSLRPYVTAAARARQRDDLLDENLCPFWIDEYGIRHLLLPGGLDYAASEEKLVEMFLSYDDDPDPGGRRETVLYRMTTPDERAILRAMLDEFRDRGVVADIRKLVPSLRKADTTG